MSYKASYSPVGAANVRQKTALSLNPLITDVGEGTTVTYTGQLTEASGPNVGAGIPNKTIRFFVDGVDTGVTAVTDLDGNYSLDYAWMTVGDYAYETRYLGD